MRYQPAVNEPIAEELRLIRQNVPGVRGTITAASDGLLAAHDAHDLEPTQVAALVAATHAAAVQDDRAHRRAFGRPRQGAADGLGRARPTRRARLAWKG